MSIDRNKANWKLTIAYDGTDYYGWQIQPGLPTIQGEVADAIARVTGERTLPQGSGRTDTGVHAHGQVASFQLTAPIPPENLMRALNRILPPAIRVLAAEPALPGFHARHNAVAKTYRYLIFAGAVCPPSLARFATRLDRPLDFYAMQQAADLVVGQHDFTSFAASDPDRTARNAVPGCGEPTPATANPQASRKEGAVRRIEVSQWSRVEIACSESFSIFFPDSKLADADFPLWAYTVRGSGFLHHMVRNLVGTFLEAGQGRMSPEAVGEILAGRNRRLAGPTAPARGLWLVSVQYEADQVLR